MELVSSDLFVPNQTSERPIQARVNEAIDELLVSFPDPASLTATERRGIIARYTAVLEGNFIYWMTAGYLSVRTEQARSIILENLLEEVRDNHPGMMRRFAMSAQAVPTDSDALAVHRNLSNVRQFMGRLSGVKVVLTLAFFEGFIQRFMPYLAGLAVQQGSKNLEYTDVHSVCDIAHTDGLFRALDAEMELSDDTVPSDKLFEGIDLLSALIANMGDPTAA